VIAVEAGEAALAYEGPVDVWLMDVRLPGITGVQVAAAMRDMGSTAKVLS
jgi:CheY-like chemotaxis protein